MRKRPAAALAACLLTLALVGCGGGGGGGGEEPGMAPRGAGGPSETVSGQPPVGVQPVPDTPVEDAKPGAPVTSLPQPGAAPQAAPPPAPRYTREWVVSPAGNDAGAGDSGAPFRTINKAVSVAGPGELIRVLAGTYQEKVIIGPAVKAGTPEAKVTLQGEGKPRIVPGTGAGAMLQVQRPHWVVDGFEFDAQNQAVYAVTFEGDVTGSVLANSELHHGTLGGGITTFNNARGATIENNHLHHFVRTTGNGDSHGIVLQPTTRNITIRNNDIHDNSGDSVQCLGPEGFSNLPPADGVVIENNHLYNNRENAVDIKTCFNVTIRNNRMHGFRPTSTAKGDALVVHYSARNITIENNEVYDAAKGISIGGNHEGTPPRGIVIRRNRVHDITTAGGGEGSGIRLEVSEGTVVVNNTLARIQGAALLLGHGTGGPTSNLTVKNNIIDGAGVAVSLGTQRPGLQAGSNLFGAGAQFSVAGTVGDFGAYQAQAGDASSSTGDARLDGSTDAPGTAAIDRGSDVGLPFCGAAPDIGAVETGC